MFFFSFCLCPSYLPLTSKMDTLCSNPPAILSLLPYKCKTKQSAVVILHTNLLFCLHVCILGCSQGLLRGTVYSVPSTIRILIFCMLSPLGLLLCTLPAWVCLWLTCVSCHSFPLEAFFSLGSQLLVNSGERKPASLYPLCWIPNSRNSSSQCYHYLCVFLFCLWWFWTQYFLSWAPSERGLQLWINTSKSEPKFRWKGSLSCLLYSYFFR